MRFVCKLHLKVFILTCTKLIPWNKWYCDKMEQPLDNIYKCIQIFRQYKYFQIIKRRKSKITLVY